jgi:hypothetical protein
MIKIYNYSKISDEVWLPILKEAFRLAKLKGKLVVIITKGKIGGGTFYRPPNFFSKKLFKSKRFIKSELGFVVINPCLAAKDALQNAESNCITILHEFKHASGHLYKMPFDSHKVKYSNRCHEKRARWFSKYEVKICIENMWKLAVAIDKLMPK